MSFTQRHLNPQSQLSHEKDSINFDIAYYKSRYDKGDADYINCPMDKEQYEKFKDDIHRVIKDESLIKVNGFQLIYFYAKIIKFQL